jgi:hypothetical protein
MGWIEPGRYIWRLEHRFSRGYISPDWVSSAGLAGEATWPAAFDRESAGKRFVYAADRWPTSGHLGRSSFCGDYRLEPAYCGDFRLIPARDLRGVKRSRRSLC